MNNGVIKPVHNPSAPFLSFLSYSYIILVVLSSHPNSKTLLPFYTLTSTYVPPYKTPAEEDWSKRVYSVAFLTQFHSLAKFYSPFNHVSQILYLMLVPNV
jgi:hypothetical protein